MKAQAHSILRDEYDFVVAVRELRIDQPVIFFDLNGDDAALAHVGVIGKVGFLHNSRLRCENDMEIFVPGLIDSSRTSTRFFGLNPDRRCDFFIGAQL